MCWGVYLVGCVWVLCAETLHSCWPGFLFLDAFLPLSPRILLLGIWAPHFPNSGRNQAKDPACFTSVQFHLGGRRRLAWLGSLLLWIFLDLEKAVLPGPASCFPQYI